MPSPGRRASAPHGPARAHSGDELREGFIRLLQRSCERAASAGQEATAYRSIARTLRAWCGEPWVHRTVFPAEHALVRQFITQTGLQPAAPEGIVQHSLMANTWIRVSHAMLGAMAPVPFLSLCEVAGQGHLHAALAAGRGVVLAHAHTLFVQLFWTWMSHEAMDPGVSIWQWAWGRTPAEIRDPRVRAIESARELHRAARALRRGGQVQILADGLQGRRKLALAFCGRMRGFETTFADLALETGAAIVPVAVSLTADATIRIEFSAPLAEPVAGADRSERLAWYVRGYAEHLHRQWRRRAGDLSWFQMRKHLEFPPAGR